MSRVAQAFVLAAALGLGACESAGPVDTNLGPAHLILRVEILGDGFVVTDGETVPRERFILQLRLRVRGMSAAEQAAVRVQFVAGADKGDAGARELEWLLDQLQIMGVGQVQYL
jgi:hypothetical protein